MHAGSHRKARGGNVDIPWASSSSPSKGKEVLGHDHIRIAFAFHGECPGILRADIRAMDQPWEGREDRVVRGRTVGTLSSFNRPHLTRGRHPSSRLSGPTEKNVGFSSCRASGCHVDVGESDVKGSEGVDVTD